MKTILCYGDSNTWGYNPATGDRFNRDKRWPGVIRNDLGEGYHIIEEGLNGRTTVWDDPLHGGYKNGKNYLIPCLSTHKPLNLVILFLGTNDLKMRFSLSAFEISQGLRVLTDIILKSESGINGRPPQLLLIAPPPVKTIPPISRFSEEFSESEIKSQKLGEYYQQVAEEYGCEFFNAAHIVTSSSLDGIHLDEKEHIKLGHKLAEFVRNLNL
ncbi:SGNH/GDSL hydrolase family protein [Methanobacterium alcaliphilum]|uniref:SGNH/GDSL hydrolase family protein n=1 Tax=Methanobacterium alcaliphilum TaxID=392018 RepID=UPI00200ADF0A|nr:SGNH/GDSL hydrolase family protein [Methanobacterium alcaliphilum]MCK9152108.1 SGNH/GDSL hydrolase family protein [Methanobacterium alcaliphilum]